MKTGDKRGFTLIELLVVIAIIGILSTLAIIALGSARQKARDSKRVADLNQIGKALELFYSDNNIYPTLITAGQPIVFGSTTYLAQVPSNPTPRNEGNCGNYNYIYESAISGNGYTLSSCIAGSTGSFPAGGIFVSSANGSSVTPCGGLIVDRDGYTYRTVLIGTQCWMADNLSTRTKPNGVALTSPGRECISTTNTLGTETDCTAGRTLYRYTEAFNGDGIGGQGMCPSGWHIPTEAEMHTLELNFTSPPNTEVNCSATRLSAYNLCDLVGTALKTGGAANFNGVPSGYRSGLSGYDSNNLYWLARGPLGYSWRGINAAQAGLSLNAPGGNDGSSVRCIKN